MFRAASLPSPRHGARSGATSPSTSSRPIGMGVTMALVGAILPTIARRGGLEPARAVGAGRGAVRREPARGVRRPGRAALPRRSWPRPRRRRGVAPAPRSSCPSARGHVAVVAIAFWLSLSFGGPFHLRLWGAMYPARLRGRVVGVLGHGPGRSRGGRRARPAASSPTASAASRRSPSPARRRRDRVFGYVGFAWRPPADPPAPFSARESIRALRERPRLGRSRSPRASTAAG